MTPAQFEQDPVFEASGVTDARVDAIEARLTAVEEAPAPSSGGDIVEVWRTTNAHWQNGFTPWLPGDAGQAIFVLYANGFMEAQIPQLIRMGDPSSLNGGVAAPAGDGMRSYMILDNIPDRFSLPAEIAVTASSHTWAVFGNATADIVPGIEYYLGTFGAAPDTGQLWVDTNVNFAGRSATYVAHPSVMLRYPTDLPEVD